MPITPRFYSKKELALLYFPDSEPRTARAHLRRWIAYCKPLQAALRPNREILHSTAGKTHRGIPRRAIKGLECPRKHKKGVGKETPMNTFAMSSETRRTERSPQHNGKRAAEFDLETTLKRATAVTGSTAKKAATKEQSGNE